MFGGSTEQQLFRSFQHIDFITTIQLWEWITEAEQEILKLTSLNFYMNINEFIYLRY